MEPNHAWLKRVVTQWVNDGWTGSRMTKLREQQINASNWSLFVKYDDLYGEETYTICGWYLVTRSGEDWRVTAYADADCSAVF